MTKSDSIKGMDVLREAYANYAAEEGRATAIANAEDIRNSMEEVLETLGAPGCHTEIAEHVHKVFTAFQTIVGHLLPVTGVECCECTKPVSAAECARSDEPGIFYCYACKQYPASKGLVYPTEPC